MQQKSFCSCAGVIKNKEAYEKHNGSLFSEDSIDFNTQAHNVKENISTGDKKREVDFPSIKKAVLYKNDVPEELATDDERIVNTINYIIGSVEEESYWWVKGVLEAADIDKKYKNDKQMYLYLEFEPWNANGYADGVKYDSLIISGTDAIMIVSDSLSYHGEGNSVNWCITPYMSSYRADGITSPEILPLFF